MSFFDNLKLRTKSLIPPLFMAALFIGVVGFGAGRLSAISNTTEAIVKGSDPALLAIARSGRTALKISFDVYRMLAHDGDSKAAKDAHEDFLILQAKGDDYFDKAINLAPSRAEHYKAFKARFDALIAQAQRPVQIGLDTPGLEHGGTLSPIDLNEMAEGAKLMTPIDEEVDALNNDMAAYNKEVELENDRSADNLVSSVHTANWSMIMITGFSILGGVSFSLWLSASAIGPLKKLGGVMAELARGNLEVDVEGQNRKDEVGEMAATVQVFKNAAGEKIRLEEEAARQRKLAEDERHQNEAIRQRAAQEQEQAVSGIGSGLEQLASGNLTFRISSSFAAEYEKLRSNFNDAMSQLQEAMQTVVTRTQGLRSGGAEISMASADLAKRTEKQAASLEETAAALNQITTTVKRSADSAVQARNTVANTKAEAEKSSLVVKQAEEAMNKIEESSKQIGQIITVIDEIAFQTNLLALNAGVEAARAGEAGKGFAVVASEVRALAQRSADAAKDIKTLISASSQQVEQGVALVGETGKALIRIAHQVNDINESVNAIAVSAQDQSQELLAVNAAVNEMDQETQKNAAMVEETTAASASLSEETNALAELIRQFKVEQSRNAYAA